MAYILLSEKKLETSLYKEKYILKSKKISFKLYLT